MTELQWKCDVCDNVIGNSSDGWVYITQEEILRAYEVDKAWRDFDEETSGKVYTIDALINLPTYSVWSTACRECFDSGKVVEVESYDIEVDRISTYKDALDWTLHLMEKDWFHRTNWDSTVREASKATLDA